MRTAYSYVAAAVSVISLAAAAPAARADLAMTSIGGQPVTSTIGNYSLTSNLFTFSMTNTSLSGTITAIGFDLPGVNGTYSLAYGSDRDFTLYNDVRPQAGAQIFAPSFEIALLTGSNFGGGTVAEGIGEGDTATFAVRGDFGNLSAEQVAQSSYARFQAIGSRDKSDVTRVDGNAVIPEPGTLSLVAAGFLPLAAGLVRRRKSGRA